MNVNMLVVWMNVLDTDLKIIRYWTGSPCDDLRSGTEWEKRGDRVTTLTKQRCTL